MQRLKLTYRCPFEPFTTPAYDYQTLAGGCIAQVLSIWSVFLRSRYFLLYIWQARVYDNGHTPKLTYNFYAIANFSLRK